MHFFPVLPPPVVTQSSDAEIKRFLLFCIFQMWKSIKEYFDILFRYPHSYYLPLFCLDNMHTTVKIKISLTRHNTMVCSFQRLKDVYLVKLSNMTTETTKLLFKELHSRNFQLPFVISFWTHLSRV